jgi:large conductance mechanosensitive channel
LTDSAETKKAKAAAAKAAATARGNALREKAAKTGAGKGLAGFIEFFRKQGVVGLAIGFVVGTQARMLVDQFNSSFVNPILGLVVGTGDGLTAQTFDLTVGGKTATFTWGAFVYSLINFFTVALIIYFVFRLLRLDKLDKS